MSKFTSPLDGVRVAAPCSADWERMRGDERVHFCGECSLNVYNLSAMSRREAEALITSAEGRLCVRYYRRADGTILTRNCPVGLRAVKRRVAGVARAVASAALSFIAGLAAFAGWRAADDYSRAELGAHAIPAPELPDLSDGRVLIVRDAPVLGGLTVEPVELVAGRMEIVPAEGWVEGQSYIPDEPREVKGRVMTPRRKAGGR